MDSRDRIVSDKTGFLRQVVDIGLSHLIAVIRLSSRNDCQTVWHVFVNRTVSTTVDRLTIELYI